MLLWTLVPLLWMLMSSLKPQEDLTSTTPQVTFTPTLEHYRDLFTGGNNIGSYAVNSILAAGDLDDHRGRARHARRLRPGAQPVPRQGPRRVLDHLDPHGADRGRRAAAVRDLPRDRPARHDCRADRGLPAFNLPFAIWIMNAFFADLPPSLEEAALVDGARAGRRSARSPCRSSCPGIATTAILCLVFSWNDYAFASTFSGPDSQTLPIAASQLVTQTEIDWGQLTAIGTIVVAPMIVVGLVVRKWLVTGLTLGRGDRRVKAAVLTRPARSASRSASARSPGRARCWSQITAVGVCGSDVHYYEHGRIGPYVVEAPLVLGPRVGRARGRARRGRRPSTRSATA